MRERDHRIYDPGVPGRTDTLVQTLLAPDLAAWVRARAALEGLQVSGWVRQLIIRERLRLVVDAWWCARRAIQRRRRSDHAPFRLERLGAASGGDTVEYRLLDADQNAIDDSDLAGHHEAIWNALYDGAFVLRGDPRLWRVVHAAADADANNGMRLVMRPEPMPKRTRRTS